MATTVSTTSSATDTISGVSVFRSMIASTSSPNTREVVCRLTGTISAFTGRTTAFFANHPEQPKLLQGPCRSSERRHETSPGRRADNLIEVPKENWSFGNGVAQYLPSSH